MHAVRHTDDASTWTPAPDSASGDSGIGGGGAAVERGEFGDEEEDFVAEVGEGFAFALSVGLFCAVSFKTGLPDGKI